MWKMMQNDERKTTKNKKVGMWNHNNKKNPRLGSQNYFCPLIRSIIRRLARFAIIQIFLI
jgi:hypothetical protein